MCGVCLLKYVSLACVSRLTHRLAAAEGRGPEDTRVKGGARELAVAQDGRAAGCAAGAQFTCFTGTRVHILTRLAAMQVLSLLALLVQKYTY